MSARPGPEKVVTEIDNPVYVGDDDLENDRRKTATNGTSHGTGNGNNHTNGMQHFEEYEHDHINEVKFGRRRFCSWTRVAIVVLLTVIIIALILGVYFGANRWKYKDDDSKTKPVASERLESSEVRGSFTITKGATFTASLQQPTSEEFINLASTIEKILDNTFRKSHLKDSYGHSRVTQFSRGSVVCECYVVFKDNYAPKKLEVSVEDIIRGSPKSDSEIVQLGPYAVKSKTINFSAIRKSDPNYVSPPSQRGKESTTMPTTKAAIPTKPTKPAVVVIQKQTPVTVSTTTQSVEITTTAPQTTTDAPTPAPPQLPLRLEDGRFPWEGRVEILHEGQWKTVCDDLWDDSDAMVVCRQLNYSGPATAHTNARFGAGVGEFWAEDVQCLGTEPYLSMCSVKSHVNCRHIEDAGVQCSPPTQATTNTPSTRVRPCTGFKCFGEDVCLPATKVCDGRRDCAVGDDERTENCPLIDVRVQLVNGSSHSQGEVEVFFNGTWGTVCDNGFDFQDAKVICRMLNLSISSISFGSVADQSARQPERPIWLSGLRCTGDEQSLSDCHHDGWGQHVCTHRENVAVQCKTTVLLRPCSGVLCNGDKQCVLEENVCDGRPNCPSGEDEASCPQPAFRLVNGGSSNEGRVEILHKGEWGTICDDSFRMKEAAALCRILGYSGNAVVLGSAFGGGTGPVWLSGLTCEPTATIFSQCHHNGWARHACTHGEDVSIACLGPTPFPNILSSTTIAPCRGLRCKSGECILASQICDGNIDCLSSDDEKNCTVGQAVRARLVDGAASNEGRVEVLKNNTWGSICSNGFLGREASVICGMLGMNGSATVIRNTFGPSVGPIWLSELFCTGLEKNIDQCEHGGWNGMHSCDHSMDVAVRCGNIETTVKQPSTTETVTQTLQADTTKVTMVTVGLNDTDSTTASQTTALLEPITPSVTCNGHVCSANGSCIPYHAVCDSVIDCPDGSDEINCKPPSIEIRLADGSSSNTGRLEIKFNSTWGTVCDDGFTQTEASVICTELGFSSLGPSNVDYSTNQPGTGQIWLSQLNCSGTETSVAQCSHIGWGTHNCNHTQDVAISCTAIGASTTGGMPTTSQTTLYENMTAATTSEMTTHSTMETLTDTTPTGGSSVDNMTTADSGNDTKTMRTVTETNLEQSTVATGTTSNITMPVTIPDLHCPGNTCPDGTCVPLDLECPFPEIQLRLADGSAPHEGRLEVLFNGTWGTVCDDGFTRSEAEISCRMLGFGLPAEIQRRELPGTGLIWLSNLLCQGYEKSLAECSHSGWSVHNCRHIEDVVLSCSPNSTATMTPPVCEGVVCPTGECIPPDRVCNGREDCFPHGEDEQNCSTPNVTVRLVNGSHPSEGLVQIKHRGVWGTVCTDGFTDVEAGVVCRMLGFGEPSRSVSQQWQGTGKIWLSNLYCQGDETSIADCAHGGWGVHNCDHTEDIGVSCTPPSTTENLITTPPTSDNRTGEVTQSQSSVNESFFTTPFQINSTVRVDSQPPVVSIGVNDTAGTNYTVLGGISTDRTASVNASTPDMP